ncbi:MAG: hypothetical protein FE834_06040, partial [Gammaproteobacteria bacterium]|nr:hypothetical protein [Gammaproteobacteria bacterium]
LVGCDTDGINQTLTKDFAKAVYTNENLKNIEVTGRKGEVQINADGTKTMVVGGEKMIYQWNEDLKLITQQTEESKRVAEVLEGLKLGGGQPKDTSKDEMGIDIDRIPDTLTSDQVDVHTSIGKGQYKTAYAFKNEPDLLVLLLTKQGQAEIISKEINMLEKLNSFDIKTPRHYKKIRFVDESKVERYGLVVQKIKGAKDIKLTRRDWVSSSTFLPHALNKSNDHTLKDIKHLQTVFAKNPDLSVTDFQGLIAEDGQVYIMDPLEVTVSQTQTSYLNNAKIIDALQTFEQHILKHHRRFTDKTKNHITYVDKELWESNDTLKQQMLSDAQEDKNKVIIIRDFAMKRNFIAYQPNDSRDLTFDTIEVIASDANTQTVDLKKNCFGFINRRSWRQDEHSTFRVNTYESYATLNLKSAGKNKHSIILQLGDDKISKEAAKNLVKKNPENTVIVTLDAQSNLVFPQGVEFKPDDSVRFNIVGHHNDLQTAGAQQLADYTDQVMTHYNVNSLNSDAYLNRAALVGCKSDILSQEYATQLYKKPYLRGADVTGREGDIQVNLDGKKTMEPDKKKIIYNWNYLTQELGHRTQKATHTGQILEEFKLGKGNTVDFNTKFNSSSLDVDNVVGRGDHKTAYRIKGHDDYLFLSLEDEFETLENLKKEIALLKQLEKLGIKTPKYYSNTATFTDADGKVHHGVVVEKIKDATMMHIAPDFTQAGNFEQILRSSTERTVEDFKNLLIAFEQNPELAIGDLQALLGHDGQVYIIDPLPLEPSEQANNRNVNLVGINEFSNMISAYHDNFADLNKKHLVFVDTAEFDMDSTLKEKLILKARKDKNTIVVAYNFQNNTQEILYKPDNVDSFDTIEVVVKNADANFKSFNDLHQRWIPLATNLNLKKQGEVDPALRFSSPEYGFSAKAKEVSRYKHNIVFQLSDDKIVKNAAQALANKHPENSYIAKMDADGNIKVYDLNGNEVNLNVNGRYRISVLDHGFAMHTLGAQALTQHIQNLQTHLKIEAKDKGRIGLVGCETDKISSEGGATGGDKLSPLAKSVAEKLFDNGRGVANVEVTGRIAQIEVNSDGTKTMQTGGTKTVYSWDMDTGSIKQRTEAVKRHRDTLTNPLNFPQDFARYKQRLSMLELTLEDWPDKRNKFLEGYSNAKLEDIGINPKNDNLVDLVKIVQQRFKQNTLTMRDAGVFKKLIRKREIEYTNKRGIELHRKLQKTGNVISSENFSHINILDSIGRQLGVCFPLTQLFIASYMDDKTDVFFRRFRDEVGGYNVEETNLINKGLSVSVSTKGFKPKIHAASLKEGVKTLKNHDGNKILLLNTENHSTVMAKKDGKYMFFDPNVGMVEFSNSNSMYKSIKRHFKGQYGERVKGGSLVAQEFDVDTFKNTPVKLSDSRTLTIKDFYSNSLSLSNGETFGHHHLAETTPHQDKNLQDWSP